MMKTDMKNHRSYGLYIHIPFCARRCLYCDFVSSVSDSKAIDRYVEYLKKELSMKLKPDDIITSIFMGGGSPSVLPVAHIEDIMAYIRSLVDIGDIEITIECNPGQVSISMLHALKKCGINRISFGVQSLNDDELRLIGRIHDSKTALDSIAMAESVGFNNINADLMYGLPNQSIESFHRSLDGILDSGVTHLSAYSLILEEGTYLYENRDRYTFPSEDEIVSMQELVLTRIKEYGMHRYEISNYAIEGKECIHNMSYWTRKNYIGVGLAAASLMDDVRITNTSVMSDYIQLIDDGELPVFEEEYLTREDAMAECMFLGLRTTHGVDKKHFYESFGIQLDDVYGEIHAKYTGLGYMVDDGKRVYLNDKGLLISNTIMCEYM